MFHFADFFPSFLTFHDNKYKLTLKSLSFFLGISHMKFCHKLNTELYSTYAPMVTSHAAAAGKIRRRRKLNLAAHLLTDFQRRGIRWRRGLRSGSRPTVVAVMSCLAGVAVKLWHRPRESTARHRNARFQPIEALACMPEGVNISSSHLATG